MRRRPSVRRPLSFLNGRGMFCADLYGIDMPPQGVSPMTQPYPTPGDTPHIPSGEPPVGEPPGLPEEWREPPQPSQPPEGEPPPPHEPNDPEPSRIPTEGDPPPPSQPPMGDPPDTSRQVQVSRLVLLARQFGTSRGSTFLRAQKQPQDVRGRKVRHTFRGLGAARTRAKYAARRTPEI
jgi:hypothetical protein